MVRDPARKPALSPSGQNDAADKHRRLSAALRDNLLKRKMQQRARVSREESAPEAAEAVERSGD